MKKKHDYFVYQEWENGEKLFADNLTLEEKDKAMRSLDSLLGNKTFWYGNCDMANWGDVENDPELARRLGILPHVCE